MILDFFNSALSYIGPFFILLGLLIFVHELGHFLVAKFYGVKVEVFSLGFGKKILQYQYGDTNYCVSIVPLGGYVKMYGDDPSMEIPDDMKDKAFLLKPVWPRIAIVLAGPLMNLFFAAVVFGFVAIVGEKLQSTTLGDIKSDSPAYEFGFRSGDKVLKVDGKEVRHWDEMNKIVKAKPNDSVLFEVQRESNNQIEKLRAETILIKNPNLLSTDRMVGSVKGLKGTARAAVVGLNESNGPSREAGMTSVEWIKKINGKEVKYFRELEAHLAKVSGSDFTITTKAYLDQDSKERTLTISSLNLDKKNPLKSLGWEQGDLFLHEIKKDSPAMVAGFVAGDRLFSVGGVKLTGWEDVVNSVKSYKGDGSPLKFEIRREGEPKTINVIPKMTELMKPSGAEDNRFTIGIIPAVLSTYPDPVLIKYTNISDIVSYGVEKSWLWTKMVALSFVRMIQNEVSPKNIGSVITIGKYAGQSYKVGLSPYLKLMAIISINLFILNLLPVPILDGGHLLFFTIEAIRGAPLSMKKMEMAQQVGLIILMTLMVFALFNDITNLMNPPW